MANTQASKPAAQVAAPSLTFPTDWPGAFDLFKYSREAVRLNLNTLIVLWLIDIAGNLLQHIRVLGPILSFAVSLLVSVSFILALLASVRGKRMSISEAIDKSWPFLLRMLGLSILVGLSIVGGLILLIVPGLIILPRLTLAHYFLIDKDLGVIDAYKASWNATKGHSGKVWGIIGVSVLMILPIITIIGIIATVYLLVMYSAAFALLYIYINKKQPGKA